MEAYLVYNISWIDTILEFLRNKFRSLRINDDLFPSLYITQMRSKYDRLGQRMWADMINVGFDAMVEDASEFNVRTALLFTEFKATKI